MSRAEWEAARQGKATVRDLIRQDVDEAIRQAYTYQSFLSQLRRMGYRVKTGPRVKHTAILPPGGKGYIRLDSLKDGYTEADIQARLAAVRSGEAPPDTPPTTFPVCWSRAAGIGCGVGCPAAQGNSRAFKPSASNTSACWGHTRNAVRETGRRSPCGRSC